MDRLSSSQVRRLLRDERRAAQERSDVLQQAAGDRVRIEVDAAKAVSSVARKSEAERLRSLVAANAQADAALKRASKRASKEAKAAAKAERDQRRRVLGAFEDRSDLRQGAQVQARASQESAILRSQVSGELSQGQADEALSLVAIDDARASVEGIKADIADLNTLKEQGYIDEQEWLRQSGDLQENLAKANLGLIQAELAEKQRAQRAAVELIQQEGAIARVALDERVQGIDEISNGLKQQQGLLSAAAGLQSALADQEKARFDAAIAGADSAAERQKIEEKFAGTRVDNLLAAQEIERQQLSLSQQQADAELARQGILAEIAQLEAEIALEKLKASGASEKEIEAQSRILDLRKKQVADLGKAAIAQQGIQALQSQTLRVQQGTARRRLGTELRGDRSGSRGRRSGSRDRVRAGSGDVSRLGAGFDNFSQDERQRLASGDRVRGLRVISSETVRGGRLSGDSGRTSAGVRSALGRLNRGGGDMSDRDNNGFEKVFRQIQTAETSRVVDELKALHQAVRDGNEQGQVPNSLTIQSPEPVQDATKIIRDLSRRSTR